MQINEALIDKLSRLAMLQFEPDEKKLMEKEIEKLLGFINKIEELNMEGIEPLTHLPFSGAALRTDEPSPPLDREVALMQAPYHTEEYFIVPKAIKKP